MVFQRLIYVTILLLCTACDDATVRNPAINEAYFEIEWPTLIPLDAEALCETGIEEAYSRVSIHLSELVTPKKISQVDTDNDDYIIKFENKTFPVYIHNENTNTLDCWEIATGVFFQIVNEQLVDSEIRFYAVYGGNDLFGGFMKPKLVQQIKDAMPGSQNEWPYLPTNSEIKK